MPNPYLIPVGYGKNDPKRPQNPTLIPNFDRGVASGRGTVGLMSPQAYLAANPRVNATATVTLGGTVAASDVTTVTVTHAQLPGGALTESYTATGSDTLATIAEELASLFTTALDGLSNPVALEVVPVGAVLTFNWQGPVGNLAVVSATVQGSMTATLNPVSGDLTGGSGPVLAYSNFTFFYRNVSANYWDGQPYSMATDLVSKMVTQGMPIY